MCTAHSRFARSTPAITRPPPSLFLVGVGSTGNDSVKLSILDVRMPASMLSEKEGMRLEAIVRVNDAG